MKISFTIQEKEKLNKNNIIVEENKEYTKDDINQMLTDIGDIIFSKSSKNGDINKCYQEFDGIMNTLRRSINEEGLVYENRSKWN